jgi:DNA invertase Pin-like site-specific DNA recombinase
MKAAIYARVSTLDQEPENQLQELRRYVNARGWSATEFVDRGGVAGAGGLTTVERRGASSARPALGGVNCDSGSARYNPPHPNGTRAGLAG